MSNLRQKTITAFKWSVLTQIVNFILMLGINLIMARWLSPDDFGLIAVPFIVYTFLRVVQDLGFGDVVQKQIHFDVTLCNNVYWLIVFIGTLISLLFYLLAPYVSYWTGLDASSTVSHWLALALWLGSFGLGFDIAYRKLLDFKALFYIDFFSNIISSLVALYLVYKGYGWPALIVRILLQVVIQTLLQFSYSSWRPQTQFSMKALQPDMNFALSSISIQVLNYIARNIDTVLVARYAGNTAAGIYDRAYKLFLIPIQQVNGSFSKVILPSFASIQEDQIKLAKNFLSVIRLISLVVFPIMVVAFLLCDLFVPLVIGEKWLAIIPIFKVFCVIGLLQSISMTAASIFTASNKIDAYVKYNLYAQPIYLLTIVLTAYCYKDALAVAIAVAIASTILAIPLWQALSKVIGIGMKDMIQAVLPQLVGVILVGLCVFSFRHFYKNTDWSSLLLNSLLSVVVYYIYLILTKNKAFAEARNILEK